MGASSAGKGDDRRPTQVDEATFNRRWEQTFSSRCGRCGRSVQDYVREKDEVWCPWCDTVVERAAKAVLLVLVGLLWLFALAVL